MTSKRSISIGPISKYPSWDWIGPDTSQELRSYFEVSNFSNTGIPPADVVLIIKWLPSEKTLTQLKARGSKIIFLPIDFYQSSRQIQGAGSLLGLCDLIAVHSESLQEYFSPFTKTDFIEHHDKFSVEPSRAYGANRAILWIGALENVPYLLQFCAQTKLPRELEILSNPDNPNSTRQAKLVAEQLGIDFKLESGSLNGFKLQLWSPEAQSKMLKHAGAAIDIKGNSFNQQHKPPTKAQKYICSGLPTAMNTSESVRYFARRGLSIPEPSDPRWLSEDYFNQVAAMSAQLREKLSLRSVGLEYKRLIDSLA